jgi:RNA polymerase sigma-70 factor (ECF subfamily)
MTVSNPSIPLVIREQTPRLTVETSKGKPVPGADAEARALAAAVGRGDETAFRKLYENYHQRLFRLALVLARGDESIAHDAAQATFVSAAKKLRRADSEEHLWNWLARVARQHIAKVWRKRQRDSNVVTVASVPDYAITEPDSFLEETLDAALQTMESEDRKVVELFYFDHLSHKEIAEQLSTTPKAISSRLERTREKLRALIKRKLSHET